MFNSTNYLGCKFTEKLAGESYNQYWAHLSHGDYETLYEHVSLVNEYGSVLIKAHGLETIIVKSVEEFVYHNYSKKNRTEAFNYLSNLFYSTLGYHDAGKVNPNFQHVKMQNSSFKKQNNSLGSNHAKIGAYAFILDCIPLANDKVFSNAEKVINIYLLLCFSSVILKHHSPQLACNNNFEFDEEFINDAFELIEQNTSCVFSKTQQAGLIQNLNNGYLKKLNDYLHKEKPFTLFALLKLNFSLLTASDYLATSHYVDNWKSIPEDFGLFTLKSKKKIIDNAEKTEAYNRKTYDELEGYEINFPTEQCNANLNLLRQNLSVEIIRGIRENIDKRLFYIEAPTGGGKTNLSMLALTEFLRNDIQNGENSVSKVFYVFPFTTLITQTFISLTKTLGLAHDEIVQVHSKSGFANKETEQYGSNKHNIIDYQFLNYPISLVSHIRFFDILKSNKKSTNYILHRLANSVVIIDELQTYSPKQWDKVMFFIHNYARLFNMRFILMSATLPKIEALLSKESKDDKKEYEPFVYLNKHKHEYFTNPNFKNRVDIDFSLLDINFKKLTPDEQLTVLWKHVDDKSIEYINNGNKRVHTIIEFIFKKTAGKFTEFAMQENALFDEIFILSGTILEPRRKEIINKLKSSEYASKNILLITTQVVEAGVDIDMDLGFKDTSLIDSDEQLAGRINRNVNKPMCKLYLFDVDDAKIIYGNDDRFKQQQTNLKKDYKNILLTKNFDKVYDSVMEYRNTINKQEGGYVNLNTYKKAILKLDLQTVDSEFKLIDNSFSTETLFIPIQIPVMVPSGQITNFEKSELQFLIEKGKYNDGDVYVSGENIWQLYEEIITNKHRDFSTQKAEKIIMQGLLSKFSISVGAYSVEFKNAISQGVGEEKYGFYYLNYVDDVYDYNTGFKTCNMDAAIIF